MFNELILFGRIFKNIGAQKLKESLQASFTGHGTMYDQELVILSNRILHHLSYNLL